MFSRVAVIGAGQMGSGIAQIIAQKNISVHLIDLNEALCEKAIQSIKHSLKKLHQKRSLHLLPEKVLENIQLGQNMAVIKDCDLVIEAVPELISLKQKVFKEISHLVGEKTVIVSNTSSLPIASLAQGVHLPNRVAGLHFMQPVPLMKLVELIHTGQTSKEVIQKLQKFLSFLEKVSVLVADRPGFVVNRILMPMIHEAIQLLEESDHSPEEIDKAIILACHHPMGPLALADFIGLDTCLSIMEVLHQNLGEKYRPCSLLKEYVSKGWLGKKTKKGLYNYS